MDSDHAGAQALVVRGIEAVEATRAQVAAVEKSVDQMQLLLTNSTATAARAADALDRIARAEESRAAALQVQAKDREAFFIRLWESRTGQILLIVLLSVLLNLVGMPWMVQRIIPKIVIPGEPVP